MENPYLPPANGNSPIEVEAISTSNPLVFTDPSNHQIAKVQMVLTGLALPFFAWLTYVGFSREAYLWSIVMGSLVLVSSFGWLRSLAWFVRPFEFNVEFDSECLRIWDSREIGTDKEFPKSEIRRILIEQLNVSFATKSSRIEKGFPGIQWTDDRIDRLEFFLRHYWPEVRVDRL